MEWLIVTGIVGGVGVGLAVLAWWLFEYNDGAAFALSCVAIIIVVLALVIPPACYYSFRESNRQLEVYYENFVEPNIVEEYDDYVVISNDSAGLWQAGSYTLAKYTTELRSLRYWDDIPFIGWHRPPVDDKLKYVHVQE